MFDVEMFGDALNDWWCVEMLSDVLKWLMPYWNDQWHIQIFGAILK